jgi:hypothetical protein
MPFLTWTFRGDNRPLTQAFKNVGAQASQAGKVAGKELGTQFKSAVMAYIGAGAIIGAARKLMGEAQKLTSDAMKEGVDVEALQELQKAAELTGMTIKDLREAAPDSIEKFTELMDAIQNSGGLLDKDVVEDLQFAADTLEEVTNSFAPILGGLVRGFEFIREGGERGIMNAIGLGTKVRGFLSGSKEGVDMGQAIMDESQTMPSNTDARSERRAAADAFREDMMRVRANKVALQRGIGGDLNQTFGGEFRPETRMMSQGFMMGPIVEQLKAANLKLQELNRTVKEQ